MSIETKKTDRPKYEVMEKCYLNDRFYDPETQPYQDYNPEDDEEGTGPKRKPIIIYFEGVPNYAMKPLNDAAKAIVEKYAKKSGVMQPYDPIVSLSLIA